MGGVFSPWSFPASFLGFCRTCFVRETCLLLRPHGPEHSPGKKTTTGKGQEKVFQFLGTVESLIGKPASMTVFFDATPDLIVDLRPQSFENFGFRKKKDFPFSARMNPRFPKKGDSWVRLRVEYHPDYDALIGEISLNRKKYPDFFLRRRLLEGVRTMKKTNPMVRLSVSAFPAEDEALEKILDQYLPEKH